MPISADLDLALEGARGVPGAGEDRGSVRVRVDVDQRGRFGERVDADDAEHRAEDLIRVDLHVRLGAIDVPDDPVARLRADQRPHLRPRLQARARGCTWRSG